MRKQIICLEQTCKPQQELLSLANTAEILIIFWFQLLDRVMKLQRDLQLLELSTVSGICEKHRRLSTIAERSESAMPSIHNRTSMAAEVHDTKREDPYTTSFESYNGGASISSASIGKSDFKYFLTLILNRSM